MTPHPFTFISDEVSQDLPDIARFTREFKCVCLHNTRALYELAA